MTKKINSKKMKLEGGGRTEQEKLAQAELCRVFSASTDDLATKLDNFTKYIRRQKLTRLLSLYEIFKKVVNIKGSIVDCGVYRGFSLMAWAQMSAVLEPNNLTRRIYGFDTFEGFPSIGKEDDGKTTGEVAKGGLSSNSFDELNMLVRAYDTNRFLGHMNKVELVKGDASKTIPEFIKKNPHLVVSLLFLDFDLFGPTKTALENFYPRMPKGSILAFDELDNPLWPGETLALLETIGIRNLKIERLDFDPFIGYVVL